MTNLNFFMLIFFLMCVCVCGGGGGGMAPHCPSVDPFLIKDTNFWICRDECVCVRVCVCVSV